MAKKQKPKKVKAAKKAAAKTGKPKKAVHRYEYRS